ncbi:MAG: Crp/Fnr family transcriptional regulator [Gammaproteobacteria bacterium]
MPPSVPDSILAVLSALGKRQAVPAGTGLFHRGDRPGKFFWVLEGELHLVRFTSNGDGVVLQRCRLGPFAEASLFSERYHCDGVAVADTTLIAVPRAAFFRTFSDPEFALAYVQCLSGTVRELRSGCERLTLRRASSRIEHYLEEHGGFDCRPGQGSLKDWASQLGLSHESLYRTLAALETAGRIVREAGSVRLAE